jgi:hypothetical protein
VRSKTSDGTLGEWSAAVPVVVGATWNASMLTDSGTATRYITPGTYNITSTLAVSGNKTLIAATGSAGVTLKRGSTFASELISIGSGATLNLNTATIPAGVGALYIDGGATWVDGRNGGTRTDIAEIDEFEYSGTAVTASLIMMSGGNLNMYANTYLQNNLRNTAGYGGAVQMTAGNFTMCGGEIRQNMAGNAGGVYVQGNVTGSNAAFIMEAGSSITHNAASINAGRGGGVYVRNGNSSAAFTMNGGSISGNSALNSASGSGGGVNVFSGTFDMYGGSITGNAATTVGGGIQSGGTTNLHGNSGSVALNLPDQIAGTYTN